MSDDEHKGFLSRWSQRKVQVRQGVPAAVALPVAAAAVPPVPGAALAGLAAVKPIGLDGDGAHRSATAVAVPAIADAPAPSETRPPAPTLQDVEALTPESDYSRFVARDVDPLVKNSAMKKLFTDPHYNVMDRLDTYIDDYNTPDPIPKAMFRQLVQARMLGLLDDELEDQDLAATGKPPTQTGPVVEGVDAGAGTDAMADADASTAETADAALNDASSGQDIGAPTGAVAPERVADASALAGGVQAAEAGPQIKPLAAV